MRVQGRAQGNASLGRARRRMRATQVSYMCQRGQEKDDLGRVRRGTRATHVSKR